MAAATRVADKEGLGALSMRRIAVELQVATMTLYRHVRDKDDLLTLMIDAAFAEWQPPKSGSDWRESLASGGTRAVADLPSAPLASTGVLVNPPASRAKRTGIHRVCTCHAARSRP